MTFESGKVISFDRHKEYGFLADADGQRVYFRYKCGRMVNFCLGEKEPLLSRSYCIVRGPAKKLVDRPKVGEELYFVRESGPHGSCAKVWCFAVRYRHVEELIRKHEAASSTGAK